MSKQASVHFHRMKDMPSTHLLGTGTPMCAGCGGLETLHTLYDILGKKTVFVNAAGCMTLLSVYPFTPFRGGWLYTSMASAPAGAQGVRDAVDILLKKKKLPPEEDVEVVVITGDGSAYGMGMSATSGAMDRNLDFIYLCYDNEGYGNTGQQYCRHPPRGTHLDQQGIAWISGLQEGPVLDLGGSQPSLRGHRHRRRTAGPGKKGGKAANHDRPAHAALAGALPDRLGLRP